jgi:hypothetical protein
MAAGSAALGETGDATLERARASIDAGVLALTAALAVAKKEPDGAAAYDMAGIIELDDDEPKPAP